MSGHTNVVNARRNIANAMVAPPFCFEPPGLPCSVSLEPIRMDLAPPDFTYVGRGGTDSNQRLSPWFNPFSVVFGETEYAQRQFEDFLSSRQDLQWWLAPLAGQTLYCDCGSRHCHAFVLQAAVNSLAKHSSASRESEDIAPAPVDSQPDNYEDLTESQLGLPPNFRFDPAAVAAPQLHQWDSAGPRAHLRSPVWPHEWHQIISDIRASPTLIMWEIWAGACVLTNAFANSGWCVGPPIDIRLNAEHNLFNPLFLVVIFGIILEGRVGLLWLAPPCSTFSWALNGSRSTAVRSWEHVMGLPGLQE